MKEIKCDGHIIKEIKEFGYLGSKFDSEGRYQKEITQRIQVRGRLYNLIKDMCVNENEKKNPKF